MALEIDSYCPEESSLTINGRIVMTEKSRDIKEKHIQTKTRTILLPDAAIKALDDEIKKREEKRLSAGEKWNKESNHLFTDDLGNHITASTLRYDAFRIRTLTGNRNFDLNHLRRHAVHMMLINNIDLQQISKYLGIKYISCTQLTKTGIASDNKDWRENTI